MWFFQNWYVPLPFMVLSPENTARKPRVADLPSGYVNSLLLKMAIEIVDLPINNGWVFHSKLLVYQRV